VGPQWIEWIEDDIEDGWVRENWVWRRESCWLGRIEDEYRGPWVRVVLTTSNSSCTLTLCTVVLDALEILLVHCPILYVVSYCPVPLGWTATCCDLRSLVPASELLRSYAHHISNWRTPCAHHHGPCLVGRFGAGRIILVYCSILFVFSKNYANID
jgi:hypothetical protein